MPAVCLLQVQGELRSSGDAMQAQYTVVLCIRPPGFTCWLFLRQVRHQGQQVVPARRCGASSAPSALDSLTLWAAKAAKLIGWDVPEPRRTTLE